MKNLWPHQQRILDSIPLAVDAGYRRICISSATGTGKSRVMYELLREADRRSQKAIVYCNRRLLFEQLCQGLYEIGVSHGCRASGYRPNLGRDIQLAMIQTERSKVLDDDLREIHKAQLVLVDEAHLMGNGAAKEILGRHQEAGATVVGFTATPVGIGHMYDVLLHGASVSEGRTCGALLPARCYEPDRPNQKYIKRMKVGTERIDGKWQPIWLKAIFGRVADHWYTLNPDRRPTILFAPGVKESLWFAKELYKLGIRSAHVDAKGVWVDGNWEPGDGLRSEVLERVTTGDIEILCNRFVLREAVDLPELAHCILATRFGSETTYIQAVGRVLRYHASLPGHVVIQDHGGNCHEFGSPNADRDWLLWDTAASRDYVRREKMRNDEIIEPYTCPKCKAIRRSGSRCPECGHVCDRRVTQVIEVDGTLKNIEGKQYRPKRRASNNYIKLWESCFWSARKKDRTFAQAINAFAYRMEKQYRHRAQPNPDWPLMPLRIVDHMRRVRDVPFSDLVPARSDDVHAQDSKRQESV